MKDTIYIHEIPIPEGYGAFDEETNFNGVCALCSENEVKILVRYKSASDDFKQTLNEEICFECYSKPDYQDFLRGRDDIKIVLVKTI